MFLQVAIGAIGIGIVLMVGYLVIAQVRNALPAPQTTYNNTCLGFDNTTSANCLNHPCGWVVDNTTATTLTCNDFNYTAATNATQATVFAGFGLLAVGVIVLAAFGLINVFR